MRCLSWIDHCCVVLLCVRSATLFMGFSHPPFKVGYNDIAVGPWADDPGDVTVHTLAGPPPAVCAWFALGTPPPALGETEPEH